MSCENEIIEDMSVVDEYLQGLEEPQKQALTRIASIIRELVPEAKEETKYGMPAFTYRGKYFAGFFVFKDHMSLFPTPGPIEKLKDKLGDHATAKGTVQFTVEDPLSDELIREIVNERLAGYSEK